MFKTTIAMGLVAAAALSMQGGTLNVGDKIPEGKFNEVIWGWDGSESLKDHLGEPILVDFWGKN
jgi:hypothetical protein